MTIWIGQHQRRLVLQASHHADANQLREFAVIKQPSAIRLYSKPALLVVVCISVNRAPHGPTNILQRIGAEFGDSSILRQLRSGNNILCRRREETDRFSLHDISSNPEHETALSSDQG
jgi:hypothetical protein